MTQFEKDKLLQLIYAMRNATIEEEKAIKEKKNYSKKELLTFLKSEIESYKENTNKHWDELDDWDKGYISGFITAIIRIIIHFDLVLNGKDM